MPNRVLGIEQTQDQTKIVEATFGRRPKVFNFAIVDHRGVEPSRRAEQLSHTLRVRGFEAKDAGLATSHGEAALSIEGIRLQHVTTISQAVLHVVRELTGKSETVNAIAHFAGSLNHILFVQNGTLLLEHDTRSEGDAVAGIQSAILNFSQKFPRANLNRIVFSGEHTDLRGLVSKCHEQTGVPCGIIEIESTLDITAYRGDCDEFRLQLPAVTAALGAAACTVSPAQGAHISKVAAIVLVLLVGIAALYQVRPRTAPAPTSTFPRVAAVQGNRPDIQPLPESPTIRGGTHPNLPAYKLTGIISARDGKLAIVDSHLVREGDRLGMETVREIKDRAVVLRSPGHSRELRLEKNR